MKKLSELEKEQMSNPQLKTSSLLPDVCHDPALPVDLQPVCASQEAASIFKALSKHTAHRWLPQPCCLPAPLCASYPTSPPSVVFVKQPSGYGQEVWRATAPALPRTAPIPQP